MKALFLVPLLLLELVSCNTKESIYPKNLIVGLWQPTNEVQSLKSDGTWTDWTPKTEYKSLPTYEFTNKGKFFLDGKINESCCNPGSKYTLNDKILSFEYEIIPDCSTVKCADANTKIIEILDLENMILIESSERFKIKYKRIK